MSDIRFHRKAIHEALLEIHERDGELTPQTVVNEAREQTHVLHSRFEWDDAVAGEAYRCVQAEHLIRSVKLIYAEPTNGEERSVRAWSSLHQTLDPDKRGYQPTEDLVQDEFATKLLLRELQREMNRIKRKYGNLDEFARIVRGAIEAS